MVHIMHNELQTLAITLMNHVCKSSAPLSLEAFSIEYYMPLTNIICEERLSNCKLIFKKSSLDKPLLKNLQCLDLVRRVKVGAYKVIVKVAKALAVDIHTGIGSSKWQNHLEISSIHLLQEALSHGSADIERGFSKSCCILTVDRSYISERTLNVHLLVKDALHHI
ncbi:hypothetical protein PR048_023930 [Dryococelus australis]|uniref:Uncharacterized protein n=1 Tax=Dryococelus australis TaxID=614101 RepID=A0ABQ9GVJ5_9NEOP|nr:hypothetical protein PR048_023930 [Dryococelus australis]